MSDRKTFSDVSTQTNSIATYGDVGRWMEYILYNNTALPENSKRFAMMFNFCAEPAAVATGQDAIVLITPSPGVSKTVAHSRATEQEVAEPIPDSEKVGNVKKQLDLCPLVKPQTRTSKLLSWFIRKK